MPTEGGKAKMGIHREVDDASFSAGVASEAMETGYFEVGPVEGRIPVIPMRWAKEPGLTIAISVTFKYAGERDD